MTQNNVPTPMYILARLNLDSQCISVAKEYADLRIGLDAKPFKEALDKKKASGKAVKAANTFPGGTHDLWIRYWLAAGGIDPDKDIETITVPPPQMVANMKVGTMDCFCVCEPWNLQLVEPGHRLHRHHHRRALEQASGEVARHARAWVDKHPNAAKALLMAVKEAQMWCDKLENHEELAAIVVEAPVDQRPVADIIDRIKGKFDYGTRQGGREQPAHHEVLERLRLLSVPEPRSLVHHRGHPLGQVRAERRCQGADQEGQPRGSLARGGQGARRSGGADPASTSRGKETFFDGKVFDPENPRAYLKSLAIKRARS